MLFKDLKTNPSKNDIFQVYKVKTQNIGQVYQAKVKILDNKFTCNLVN